jgi:hypothetical protein
MHGFWHCQTVTPIENSKQTKSKAKPSTQANPAPDQASKTQQARQGKPKNSRQGFALVSDTKKQNPKGKP